MKAFRLACDIPWVIQRESLQTILGIAARMNDPEAVAAKFADKIPGAPYVSMRDSIAVVEINGPICRYMNLFSYYSGGTSAELLAKGFTQAFEDPGVKGILLNINSPGGTVDGTSELAGMIYEARKSGKKPIKAYVSDAGCSGAYWLASAADEIILQKTARVGSIGVMMTYTDYTKADEMAGIEEIDIISSNAPNKRPDMQTDEGRSLVQTFLDDIESVFTSEVARNRGVSKDTVLSDFGRGGVMVGKKAVSAGLADRVGTFEGVLKEMKQSSTMKPRLAAAMNTDEAKASTEDNPMSWLKEIAAKLTGEEKEELKAQLEGGEGEVEEKPKTPAAKTPAPDAKAAEPNAEILAALEDSRRQQKATSDRLQELQIENDKTKLETRINTIFGSKDGKTVATPATVKEGIAALLPLSAEHREAVLGWMEGSGLVELKQRGFTPADGSTGGGNGSVDLTKADEDMILNMSKSEKITVEEAQKNYIEAKNVRFGD